MATVLIVAYLLIVIAMIVVILLQRSEGGGLGMGGGGGNFMTSRGSANLLTRTTSILGTLFMVTAIGLTIISQSERSSSSILQQAAQNPDGTPISVLDALDSMSTSNGDLAVPAPAPAPVEQAAPDAQPDLAAPVTVEEPAPSDEAPAEETTTTPGN